MPSNLLPSKHLHWFWLAVGLVALAHLLILVPVPLLVQAVAVLILTGLLPGALLVEWLVGRSAAPPSLWERCLYSVGAAYSSMVLITLLLSYLPGGLNQWQTLATFDAVLVTLMSLGGARGKGQGAGKANDEAPDLNSAFRGARWAPYPVLISLLTVLLVGGFFRFVNLGYAEFQGDEARLALRAAEVIQGYENALFVHKKGPTEILLPTVIYALTAHLNETVARLPFSLANLAGLFAIFLLGWRLFGPVAGWTAALLLAIDGYLIAFGRVVQYQSIVFLMDVLVVLIFVRLAQQPKALTRYFTLAALLLATGLLSHYEAALVLFPVLYLLWRIWRQGITTGQLMRALLIPVGVGGGLLAIFYVPFVLNPGFYDTYYYLTDYRVGGGKIFNHLAEFFARTTVYSSTYYLLMLIGLTLAGLVRLYLHNLPSRLGWLATALVITGMAITFWTPSWIVIGGVDFTWFFFTLALGLAWLLPAVAWEERTVWLWFGAPLILALFFTAIPNTHVYSFFIPWALLAGMVLNRAWQLLSKCLSQSTARALALPIASTLLLLFGLYEYWLFVYNQVEVLRTWPEHRPPGYWVTYDEPVEIAIFGFPLNNGWKAVAGLYADGMLQGNYDTNTRDVIAEWYTRGEHYCARDEPRYYILTNPVEPTLADETAQLRSAVESEHKRFGTVYVQGRAALDIYERTAAEFVPQRFDLETYATRFDRQLSSPRFERAGPVGSPAITQATDVRFGESIWLRGYRLEQTTVAPGASLKLTLYWETEQPLREDYAVFVQVIDLTDLAKAGQRDGHPGCGRHPTTTWLPGDTIADPYTIAIDPTARLGPYTVLIGLYTGDQRLEVFGAEGQSLGPHLALTQVEVGR